ncbi:MAG: hemerythrin family protein [Rhodospirillales bacterium]|nr:hemerythrin family protein [Rhodospirillales bacterium]
MAGSGLDETSTSGYRGLDGEHHVQIELLATFRQAVAEERPRGEIDEILDKLIEFTKVHFNSEQLLMRLYQYPSYQQHHDDHDNAVESLQTLRQEYLAGERMLACATADDLADKLLDHIRTADRALGSFLVRLGAG